jgi:membrane protein required for colicin V production
VTPFDIIFGLILLVSALVGFARGASRELTSALSFIAAALLSLLALRVTGPLFRAMMDPDWAATAAAILVGFVIVFVLLRLVGAQITKTLHADGALGTLDRLMGLAFGVLRGLVVLGVFSLVFHMATPPDRVPHWMSKSALYPLSNAAGRVLKVFAPKGAGLAGKLAPPSKTPSTTVRGAAPATKRPTENRANRVMIGTSVAPSTIWWRNRDDVLRPVDRPLLVQALA